MIGLHEAIHTDYGVCLWTVIAFIILLAMIAFLVGHILMQRKRKADFERECDERAKEMLDELQGQGVE